MRQEGQEQQEIVCLSLLFHQEEPGLLRTFFTQKLKEDWGSQSSYFDTLRIARFSKSTSVENQFFQLNLIAARDSTSSHLQRAATAVICLKADGRVAVSKLFDIEAAVILPSTEALKIFVLEKLPKMFMVQGLQTRADTELANIQKATTVQAAESYLQKLREIFGKAQDGIAVESTCLERRFSLVAQHISGVLAKAQVCMKEMSERVAAEKQAQAFESMLIVLRESMTTFQTQLQLASEQSDSIIEKAEKKSQVLAGLSSSLLPRLLDQLQGLKYFVDHTNSSENIRTLLCQAKKSVDCLKSQLETQLSSAQAALKALHEKAEALLATAQKAAGEIAAATVEQAVECNKKVETSIAAYIELVQRVDGTSSVAVEAAQTLAEKAKENLQFKLGQAFETAARLLEKAQEKARGIAGAKVEAAREYNQTVQVSIGLYTQLMQSIGDVSSSTAVYAARALAENAAADLQRVEEREISDRHAMRSVRKSLIQTLQASSSAAEEPEALRRRLSNDGL